MDYSPNAAARALRMSRSGTIGLAVHDASNPVYTEIIAGAQDEATRAGYALMLADVNALAQGGAIFRRVISSGSIDGLLLQRAGTDADAFVSRLTEKRVPMVVLNDRTEGHLGSVGVDDYAASMLAMSHLLGSDIAQLATWASTELSLDPNYAGAAGKTVFEQLGFPSIAAWS